MRHALKKTSSNVLWIVLLVLITLNAGCATIERSGTKSSAEVSSSPSLDCPIKPLPSISIGSDQPYDTPRYKTKDMLLDNYSTENVAGNTVWPGEIVTYLDENQRMAYQLFVKGGLLYTSDGSLFDTTSSSSVFTGGGAIFVMDHYGRIFASLCREVGEFHHSSLMAGDPVAAAGELEVSKGVILVTSRRSGHYRPEKKYQDQLFEELIRQGVNTAEIKRESF